MRYKLLGKSGLRVSELCLGTMTFGEDWGWGASKEESKKVYNRFIDEGGNFIDTANLYTNGTSEKYVGEFIASERERMVLATKYTLSKNKGDPNAAGNHRKNMAQALDASLKRLNTGYIDLYWVHMWDFLTPVDEVLRALDDMIRAGKILYTGISDTPAWIISQANTLAEFKGWTRFVGLQIEYSLIQRTAERDLLPMAQTFDIAVTPWAVLGGGVLTGKYNEDKQKNNSAPKDRLNKLKSKRLNEKNFTIAEEVQKIAREIGCSASQVAINWVRQNKGVVIPVLGARTETQIADNMNCLSFSLQREHLQRLDEVSAIELGFPHDFLKTDPIREIVYGGMYNLIDNHREK